MLPYLEEYIKLIENGTLQSHISHLRAFNADDKDILKMSREDLSRHFKKSYSTNFNRKNALMRYLDWLRQNYKADIADVKYNLLQIDNNGEQYGELFFASLSELLSELDEVENKVVTEYEAEVSDRRSPEKLVAAKEFEFTRLRAFYVLLWYGLAAEDMVTIYPYDVDADFVNVPSLNKKIYFNQPGGEEFIETLWDLKTSEFPMTKLHSNNLFRTESVKTLKNTDFKAIGKVEDNRFHQGNVQKAGNFQRFDLWERTHHQSLTSKDADIVMKLCCNHIKISQITRILSEYRQYLENI